MTPFEYGGRTYYYKEVHHSDEVENWITTKIFDSPIMKRKKYFLWGKLIKVENTKEIGELYYAITSVHKTKEQNRRNLAIILGHEGREEEIKKGEII